MAVGSDGWTGGRTDGRTRVGESGAGLLQGGREVSAGLREGR